jgi:hypothetical protein
MDTRACFKYALVGEIMRAFVVFFQLTCILAVPASARAANFECAFHYYKLTLPDSISEPVELDADGKSNLCSDGLLSGTIAPNDAPRFQDWLAKNPYTTGIRLRSPGGSVDAAMQIGRIIRARFMTTSAEPHGTEPAAIYVMVESEKEGDFPEPRRGVPTNCKPRGCCLSACVLILVAGVAYDAGNIGLHRPTAEDFGTGDYASVKDRLSRGLRDIQAYLNEMEASPKLFEAMTSVSSDRLQLLGEKEALPLISGMPYKPQRPESGVVPSVYEWARARCAGEHGSGFSFCVIRQISNEAIRLSKASRQRRD